MTDRSARGVSEIIINLKYRQTCFPDDEYEEEVYSSADIVFQCMDAKCNKFDRGKISLEHIINSMLEHKEPHRAGEAACPVYDSTCKNKLHFIIDLNF